ncbi:hypothetical protein QW060_06480 [Myroides ceti]|uniref:Uncharacterized protein n=1 Tax=Paenimyroides ceti TaxID=395087 RepID=A0ABT8CUC5_9FLAO|nr:hypothetical protein [Paenimyroides ceti]MDN3706777.1 hypothetical protein [Paenimyroides ceti]
MKKMLFLAIVMIAFVGNTFASNKTLIQSTEVMSENESIKIIFIEEIGFDDERACYSFYVIYERIDGTIQKEARTVCSFHHTQEQIKKEVERAYGTTIKPSAK